MMCKCLAESGIRMRLQAGVYGKHLIRAVSDWSAYIGAWQIDICYLLCNVATKCGDSAFGRAWMGMVRPDAQIQLFPRTLVRLVGTRTVSCTAAALEADHDKSFRQMTSKCLLWQYLQ